MLLILLAECAIQDGPTEKRQLSAENWASLPTVYYIVINLAAWLLQTVTTILG